MIKRSKIPIICICNDRQSQKIRSLANHCFDLRFNRPQAQQIKVARIEVPADHPTVSGTSDDDHLSREAEGAKGAGR